MAVQGLEVMLPDGTLVVRNTDVTVRAGQVVALLGPSGGGKSTLLRAILDPDELRRRGYSVRWTTREVHASASYVPQRGALFDHLDVAGNIALAQTANGQPRDPARWLRAVDLEDAFDANGRSVGTLSGGQAQRVAIARTLAAGRKLMVLDEPSVGLDPLAVRLLAQLIVREARERQVGVIVITHDVSFAAGAADAILFLEPSNQRLFPVRDGAPGPAELLPAEQRAAEVANLSGDLERLLATERPAGARAEMRYVRMRAYPSALGVVGAVLRTVFQPRLFRDSLTVFARALGQSLVRPLPFYAVVGTLLGYTVLYVIAKMSADVRAAAMLRLVGGTYILALAPPLSAILFAATSGNAVNAWLGSMQLGRQLLALEGIGVPEQRYVWAPAWTALVVGYLVTVVGFVAAMTFGGWLLCNAFAVPNALAVLTSDILDPPPERVRFLVRALWLVGAYSLIIASVVVSRGVRHKDEANDVTRAMTSAVIVCTLAVVVLELASVVALFSLRAR